MNDDEYTLFLKVLGLARIVMKPRKQIHLVKKKWEEFLQISNLSDAYFDKYDCKNVPTSGIDATTAFEQYQGLWIGFGTHSNTKERKTNPSTQFKFHNQPPRSSK